VQELTSGALLDALRGVHWPARRMGPGTFQGGHRSRRAGSSPEFMEYRPYQQGDDASRIDWKLYGRTERVAIRLSHEDSSLRTMVLIDATASMAFPAPAFGKWRTAAAIALGLASVAHADGDPVGLGVASAAPRIIPPRTRRGTVGELLRLLLATSPAGTAPLAPLLASASRSRRVALVSDFLGDLDALLPLAREMAAGGTELYAVHVVDPAELEPGPAVRVVTDPENPALRRPLGEREQQQYREQFAAWRVGLADSWRRAGAVFHEALTSESPDRQVRRITGSAGVPEAPSS
jgi:uncharacterized protein (DUF58 family)